MEIDEGLLNRVSDFLNTSQGAQIVSELKSSLNLEGKEKEPSALLSGKKDQDAPLPIDITKLVPLVTAISTAKTDNRAANLLSALKPLLNEKRRDKVDKAISVMKIMSLIPILEEYGFSLSDIFK